MPAKGATKEVRAEGSAVNGGRSSRPQTATETPPEQLPSPALVSPIGSPFPPIADYAFLSDCEVNCLVAPSGRME